MPQRLINGLIAGLLSGLLIAFLFFVDYGPGNSLHGAAAWLGLDSTGAGKYVGFLLLIVLGGIFGLVFGAIEGKREITLGSSLLLGLLTGAIYWLIYRVFLGALIFHSKMDFGGFLISIVPLLLYGVILGSIAYQREVHTDTFLRA